LIESINEKDIEKKLDPKCLKEIIFRKINDQMQKIYLPLFINLVSLSLEAFPSLDLTLFLSSMPILSTLAIKYEYSNNKLILTHMD
jgi:hypothetical protein